MITFYLKQLAWQTQVRGRDEGDEKRNDIEEITKTKIELIKKRKKERMREDRSRIKIKKKNHCELMEVQRG